MNRKEEMERSVVDLTSEELDGIARQAFGEAAIASIIFKHVKASTHPVFVDRLCVSGIDEAAAAVFAALRASAAPEEGVEYDVVTENKAMPTLWRKDAQGKRAVAFFKDVETARLVAAALNAALPSDSGKAAPVAWRWKAKGNKHWIYDPSPAWLEDHFNDPEIEFQPLYAALAPATEIEALRAGLQLRIDQINPLVAALEKAREYVASFPYSAGSPAYLKQCSTLIEIDRALSPPSVGTPEMTSAQGRDAAQ